MVKSDKQSSLWCEIRPLISAYPDKLSLVWSSIVVLIKNETIFPLKSFHTKKRLFQSQVKRL